MATNEVESDKIKEWKGENIFYTINGIESEVNKGPIASMLRFLSVYPLMEKYSLPVLVLDLDTVIKQPFNELVVMMDKENLDILKAIITEEEVHQTKK